MSTKTPNMKIAFTHLMAKKRQTLVAMLGVTFGIAMFIFQAGLMSGFQSVFISQTINTTANIRIFSEAEKNRKSILSKKNTEENHWIVVQNQKIKEESPKIKNGLEIMKIIEKHPNVAGVSPFLGTQAIFRVGMSQIAGRIAGIEIIKENHLFDLKKYTIQGNVFHLQTIPNGIILGDGLAELLGANLNDVITVVSQKGVSLDMRVVGIHKSGLVEVDKSRAFVNIRNAQILLGVDGSYITDLNIKLKDIEQAEEMSKTFEQKFKLKAQDWKTANANVFGVFKIQNMVTVLVIASILIVSGFGIFNILMMIIYEKMQDIAILKAIGYKDKDIRSIFLTESLVIGFLGGILGLTFGYALQKIVGSIPLKIKGFVALDHLQFNSSPAFYLFAFFFGLVVTAVAGYLPARKASKVDPIEIIRGK